MNLSQYNKLWAALAGAITQALNLGLVSGTAAKWAGVAIAFITAVTVFSVPNAQPPVEGAHFKP